MAPTRRVTSSGTFRIRTIVTIVAVFLVVAYIFTSYLTAVETFEDYYPDLDGSVSAEGLIAAPRIRVDSSDTSRLTAAKKMTKAKKNATHKDEVEIIPKDTNSDAEPEVVLTEPPVVPTKTVALKKQLIEPPRVHIEPANGDAVPFPYYDKNARPRQKPTTMWPSDSSKGDSTGHIFDQDPRKYRLCTFTNVCINTTHTFISISDKALQNQLSTDLEICDKKIPSKDKPRFCMCFMKGNSPIFVNRNKVENMRFLSGHHWLLDTYVQGHQIGHYAEAHGLFHSINLQAASYGYPKLTRIIYNKMEKGLTEHEKFLYDVSISSLGYPLKEPLWKNDIVISEGGGMCMEQMSTTSITAIIATTNADASVFRSMAYRRLKHNIYTCPGSQTTILYRSRHPTRRVLNQEKVVQLLKETYKIKDLRIVTIDGTNSSIEQVKLFAETGLMISSHSSQLINLMFAQPRSSVIELSPAYYNNDFFQLGKLMEMHYQIVIGGYAPDVELEDRAKECNTIFAEACSGKAADCIMDKIWTVDDKCVRAPDQIYDKYAKRVKHHDFYVDLQLMETSIAAAIYNLHKACGGKWPGSAWTTPFDSLKKMMRFKTDIGNGPEG